MKGWLKRDDGGATWHTAPVLFSPLRNWRRRRLSRRAFPTQWEAIVAQRLPYTTRFAADELERFRLRLKVFAFDKEWVGVRGLEVTAEMKVVISGAAARLARNLSLDIYDRLRTVVVYPSHFKHAESDDVIFGQADRWGSVLLSWDAVLSGLAHASDGHNTALHEFAHVLDTADGAFDGTPELHHQRDYKAWTKAFSEAFIGLRENPSNNVLREYGATNEAEFFAVATEAFFERPDQLELKAPALYAELARYYRVSPAAQLRASSAV